MFFENSKDTLQRVSILHLIFSKPCELCAFFVSLWLKKIVLCG